MKFRRMFAYFFPMISASFILSSTGCSAFRVKPDRIDDQLSVRVIAPQTYVVTDRMFFDSNVLVAVMKDRTVFVGSSPFETVGAKTLVDWIKKKFNPIKIVAVNTHFHADGTGGNAAFNRAGVETWASDQTQELHRMKGELMKAESAAGFSDPKLKRRILARAETPAVKTFGQKEGKTFLFGGEPVQIFYPGPAHSPDNVVVILPERGILFGGCMIRSGGANSLGFLGHADTALWAGSARRLQEFSPRIVIPGHGEVGGSELIGQTVALAERTQSAEKLKSKRVSRGFPSTPDQDH